MNDKYDKRIEWEMKKKRKIKYITEEKKKSNPTKKIWPAKEKEKNSLFFPACYKKSRTCCNFSRVKEKEKRCKIEQKKKSEQQIVVHQQKKTKGKDKKKTRSQTP
jgi:hypothetical protein